MHSSHRGPFLIKLRFPLLFSIRTSSRPLYLRHVSFRWRLPATLLDRSFSHPSSLVFSLADAPHVRLDLVDSFRSQPLSLFFPFVFARAIRRSRRRFYANLWLNASMDWVCMVLEYVRRIGQVGVHRSKAPFVIYTDTCVGNMVKRVSSAQSHCARIPTFTNVLAIMRTTLARRTTRTTRSVRHRTVEVRYGLLHFVLVVVPLGSRSGISFFLFFFFFLFLFSFFFFFLRAPKKSFDGALLAKKKENGRRWDLRRVGSW